MSRAWRGVRGLYGLALRCVDTAARLAAPGIWQVLSQACCLAAHPAARSVCALQHRCLIRATDGKRKISTAVSAGDYVKFQASYGLILRAHMDALKKREKTKAKK